MSRFFIRRPIVAMVIAILTVIAGAVTIAGLPIALFPQIAPPEVQVSAVYTGADAQTIEQSVATPIEQQMSGVDNMNYMYSLNATAKGEMRMIVDFDVKTDPNTDLILSQMRSTLAASQLPAEVNSFGVTVQKTLTAPLMLISLNSPDGAFDGKFLANYAYINLNDQLTRVPGIGSVQVFGAGQYAMRLWVKPDQLAKLGITVPEIVSAIQTQNTVNPAGQVGSEPAPKGQEYTYSVRARGRRTSAEDFGQIVVRETPDGGIVRLKNVARVELGSQDYTIVGRFNGKPSAIIAVYQLPGSNAVQAAEGVNKLMAEAKKRFPEGMDYAVALDTTRSVTEGIREIIETLLIAIVLVIFVVYIFLQVILSFLAMLVVSWHSRRREFGADAFAAKVYGKTAMISALESINRWVNRAQPEYGTQDPLATYKISGKTSGFMHLFATHPPMEERIAALQRMSV